MLHTIPLNICKHFNSKCFPPAPTIFNSLFGKVYNGSMHSIVRYSSRTLRSGDKKMAFFFIDSGRTAISQLTQAVCLVLCFVGESKLCHSTQNYIRASANFQICVFYKALC